MTNLLASILLVALACTGGPTDPSPAEPSPSAELVTVAEESTRFEPAVDVAAIPDGAWMCDMGTVHYASLEKGDGTCPVCGMHLTHKGADPGQ